MTFPHKMLRELKAGWDSYGAKPIDPRCIEKAFQLWRELTGPWQVVPCNDGGVQLEQHGDGFDIEIQVSLARAEKETCDGRYGIARAPSRCELPTGHAGAHGPKLETPDDPIEGVVRGSELEQQIQAARKTIAGWPDDVKAAMGVAVETGTARCPHGYELANLADGTDTCSGCSTVNRRVE